MSIRAAGIVLVISLVGALACRYFPVRTVDGRRVYVIDCQGTMAPCRERASELCPDGYDTLFSKKESRGSRDERAQQPLPPSYYLDITCHDRNSSGEWRH